MKAPGVRGGVLVATILACGGLVAMIVELRDSSSPRARPAPLPAPLSPSFAIPAPTPLRKASSDALWSTIVLPVRARASPSPSAPAGDLLGTRTPERTSNVVLVLGKAEDRLGRLWIRIRMPGLPGRTAGWVPRRSLGAYHAVHTRLVIDLERQTATLLRGDRPLFRAPVGVGTPESPTPRGEFYVRNRLTRFRSAVYGPLAFGISAQSSWVTDWPGGGFIGIHGTNKPSLLPGRVSHGCIRLRNSDILRLGRLMPVGTPVSIV